MTPCGTFAFVSPTQTHLPSFKMAQVHPSRANLVPQASVSSYRDYKGQRGRSRSRSPERRRSRSGERDGRRASPSYGDYRKSDRDEGRRENVYANRERPPPPHMDRGGRGPMDLEECVFHASFHLTIAYCVYVP